MLSERRKNLRKIIEEDGVIQEHDAIEINGRLTLKGNNGSHVKQNM